MMIIKKTTLIIALISPMAIGRSCISSLGDLLHPANQPASKLASQPTWELHVLMILQKKRTMMILINLSMRRMVTMVMMSVKMRTVMIILIKIIMRMMVTLLAMIYQILPRRDCRSDWWWFWSHRCGGPPLMYIFNQKNKVSTQVLRGNLSLLIARHRKIQKNQQDRSFRADSWVYTHAEILGLGVCAPDLSTDPPPHPPPESRPTPYRMQGGEPAKVHGGVWIEIIQYL